MQKPKCSKFYTFRILVERWKVQFLSSKEKKHGTLSEKYLEFTFRKTTKNNVFMGYSESCKTIE